jgi:hypothetical protein
MAYRPKPIVDGQNACSNAAGRPRRTRGEVAAAPRMRRDCTRSAAVSNRGLSVRVPEDGHARKAGVGRVKTFAHYAIAPRERRPGSKVQGGLKKTGAKKKQYEAAAGGRAVRTAALTATIDAYRGALKRGCRRCLNFETACRVAARALFGARSNFAPTLLGGRPEMDDPALSLLRGCTRSRMLLLPACLGGRLVLLSLRPLRFQRRAHERLLLVVQ